MKPECKKLTTLILTDRRVTLTYSSANDGYTLGTGGYDVVNLTAEQFEVLEGLCREMVVMRQGDEDVRLP